MQMLKMMYQCHKSRSILEINDYFLKWYRAYLNSNPAAANGNYPFTGSVPGMPPGLTMPPVLYPRYPLPPLANYNVPPMTTMPPQNLQPEIMPNAEFNQDNAHAETGRHPNFTPHLPNQIMQNGMMLPERQFHRNIVPLPEEPFREYLPVYQPGMQEPIFENAGFNMADRELPPEPRPDFRMDPNYVLVNREQRLMEQIWTPTVNEELTEYKNGSAWSSPTSENYEKDGSGRRVAVSYGGKARKFNHGVTGAVLPEPRPDFRMDPNYVLVNREQRRVEQIWTPNVNEIFFEGVSNVMPQLASNAEDIFGSGVGADRLAANERISSSAYSRADEELEEELEALARRIDTEFNTAD